MSNKKWVKYIPYAFAIVFILLGGLFVVYLKEMFAQEPKPKKQVQQITVIAPPPPPPPPPPEIKEPEVKEEVVEEQPDEPEPADEVANDDASDDTNIGEGTESGLQIGTRGGVGGPKRGGGFGNSVKAEINKALMRDSELKRLEYEAIVTLWIEDDGSFLRFEVDLLRGDDQTERELERFFEKLGGLSKGKPLEVKDDRFRFRITSVI